VYSCTVNSEPGAALRWKRAAVGTGLRTEGGHPSRPETSATGTAADPAHPRRPPAAVAAGLAGWLRPAGAAVAWLAGCVLCAVCVCRVCVCEWMRRSFQNSILYVSHRLKVKKSIVLYGPNHVRN
jgi:hypothetical protein